MKVNGSVQPDTLLFEHRFDGTAEMRFRENIANSKDDKGNTIFTYDEYFLKMPDREGLEKIVQDNAEVWLAFAKSQEANKLAEIIRIKRDNLLNQCDLQHCTSEKWTAMLDNEKLAWANYKQALRDIPTQDGFPYSVNWPVIPNDTINKLSDVLAEQDTIKLDLGIVNYDTSTLDGNQKAKLANISKACQDTIYAGVDVTDTKGTEHFGLTIEDQTNLAVLESEIAKGATSIPYHADGQLCREFTADEFNTIYTTAKKFITYNVTLCNHLNVWIKRCTTLDEVNAITYQSKLPDDLQKNFDSITGSVT